MRSYHLFGFLLIGGVILWKSSYLFAVESTVGVELRSDLQWNASAPLNKKADSDQVESSYAEFILRRAALDFQGGIAPTTSYRIRLAFQEWMNSPESAASNWIEYAYIRNVLHENLSLKMGQFFIATGAWENDYNEMDQYLYSRTNTHFPMLYGTGLDLRVLAGQQTFAFQLVNSPFREPGEKETALGGTTAWYGNFYSGLLQTMLTYGLFQSPIQTSIDNEQSLEQEAFAVSQSGAGVRWNTVKLQFEVEYNRVIWPAYKWEQLEEETVEQVKQEDQLYSGIVVSARYRDPEPWHILLKYTFDQEKTANKATLQQEGWAIGAERYQTDSDQYRTHFMVTRVIEKPESASDWTHTQVSIGMSLKWP